MTSDKVSKNPNNPNWKDADHWKCVIVNTKAGKQMTTYFSKGYGHHGQEPEVEELLYSIAMDSYNLGEPFEDWCAEFGYDPYDWDTGGYNEEYQDIYKSCVKNADALKRVIGNEQFDVLLYETELD